MHESGIIKIMIVDDHPIVRVGIATIVNQQRDMEIAAEACTGARAIELFRRFRPDIVLMDLRLDGDTGARVTKDLRNEFPLARVLMISGFEGDEDIRQALEAGSMGYVFKSVLADELLDAIRAVSAGTTYLPKRVKLRLAQNESTNQLTAREADILRLLGTGLSNRQIGGALGVSEDTIKTHLKRVFRKLHVGDRAAAVREALRRGFMHLP